MDRRCLRAANNIEGDGLVSVTTKTTDLKIAVAGVEGVAEGR
jgi:hypothetical protein